MVLPWVQNLGAYGSPADTDAGKSAHPVPDGNVGPCGSFASDGSLGGWGCVPDGNFGCPRQGPTGIADEVGWISRGSGPHPAGPRSLPADTVLFTEKHTDGVSRSNAKIAAPDGIPGRNPGNTSAFWVSGVFGGDLVHLGHRGPARIPNEMGNLDDATGPDGPSGAVSTQSSNRAVFVFAYGRAASMSPARTNPNPNGEPRKNMGNGLRETKRHRPPPQAGSPPQGA
ncbi:MAG: hypothetical protein SNJ74_04635 [Fimbriimonadaceae bacterium]